MKKNFTESFKNNSVGIAIMALLYAMIITIVALSSNATAAEATRSSALKSVEIDKINDEIDSINAEWIELTNAVEDGKSFYLGHDVILHKSTDGYNIELREQRRR